MIASNNITLYTGCSGLPPGEGRSGPEAGKTSTFILYIFSAGVVPEAAPVAISESPEICVVIDRQSSQGRKLQTPLRLPSRNYIVYLLILKT